MSPLIKMLFALSLLLISPAVNCDLTLADERQSVDRPAVIPHPDIPKGGVMKRLQSMKGHRQYSSLPNGNTRIPPLVLTLPSDNVLTPTREWMHYFKFYKRFENITDASPPIVQLPSNAELAALRQGDWVRVVDDASLGAPPESMRWVRCQHEKTKPSVLVGASLGC